MGIRLLIAGTAAAVLLAPGTAALGVATLISPAKPRRLPAAMAEIVMPRRQPTLAIWHSKITVGFAAGQPFRV